MYQTLGHSALHFRDFDNERHFNLKTGDSGKKKKKKDPVPMNSRSRPQARMDFPLNSSEQAFMKKTVADITKHPFDLEIPLKKNLEIADFKRIKVIDFFSGRYDKQEKAV
jgi:hypothetical protein